MLDVIIIGAGIVGSSVAYILSKYDIKVLVLEKDNEVANGTTKANSAIIHAGNDPIPGTLKAKLNILGHKMTEEICKELNVDFQRIGSLTVAFSDEQVEMIHKLHERGKINGAETYILSREEVLEKEPNVREDVKLGLYAPDTAIIAPWDLVFAQLEHAIVNGTEVKVNQEVVDIQKEDHYFIVKTQSDTFKTRYIINAAGVFAEKISRMVTNQPGFKTIPTRGQYYVLDRDCKNYVNSVIYPTPSSKGKGVLVVPTVHGNILLGPTAEFIDDVEGTETTKEGFRSIRESLSMMMKNIPYRSNIRTFSGIRAKTDRDDFIIEELKDVPNFIQLAGIESPGLTAAPAIAKYVEDILLQKETFKLRDDYIIYRQQQIRISELEPEEINEQIKKNPLYGRIICRCEHVSEGEIMDAIHRPLGATTIDGIKRRARPGAGRCQGGFCQPHVIQILARELKLPVTDIVLNNPNSNILIEESKLVGGDERE